jgi:hypothetical protein
MAMTNTTDKRQQIWQNIEKIKKWSYKTDYDALIYNFFIN